MDIQIKVFSGVSSMEKDVRVFERIIDYPDDVQFPFHKVFEVLQVLFKGSLIQFNIK